MSITTKGGDKGFTGRLGGGRVPKNDPAVQAVGEIDELNAHLGGCVSPGAGAPGEVAAAVRQVQSELFLVGAALSAGKVDPPTGQTLEAALLRMEDRIHSLESSLPTLRGFIIPGGCEAASRLHVARAVCRRAERAVVAFTGTGEGPLAPVLRYLNRLSDLLFMLARQANAAARMPENGWVPPR